MMRSIGRLALTGAVAIVASMAAMAPASAAPVRSDALRAGGAQAGHLAAAPCGWQRGTPGQRLKPLTSPNIFLIDPDGRKRWIPTGADYFSLYSSWDGIVTDAAVDCMEEGPALSGTGLIKIFGSAEVYILDGQFRRWIPDPNIFLYKYQFSGEKIQILYGDAHRWGPDWT